MFENHFLGHVLSSGKKSVLVEREKFKVMNKKGDLELLANSSLAGKVRASLNQTGT